MSWKTFVGSLTTGIPHSDPKFRGLKVALFGFLIVLGGLFGFLGGIETVGKLIVYVGIAIALIGAALHVAAMLRGNRK